MKIPLPALGILLTLAMAFPASAGEDGKRACRAQSPGFRAAVIELYTSEGCSSCPPADDWLRKLSRDDLESARVVPLALHVDYWNYLGWEDPFSKTQFTARQRTRATHNGSRTIYTPGLFLNGREWRGWHRDGVAGHLARLASERPAANIELRVSAAGNGIRLQGVIDWNTTPREQARLYLAVVEDGLITTIAAGENAGRTLHHDHVVRYLSDGIVLGTGKTPFRHQLALASSWKKSRLGFAALVEDSRSGEIIQGVLLPRCPG